MGFLNMKTKKNNGAALITVMVIVFVIMAIITNITIKNFRIIRKLTNQNVQQQATAILAVGVNFGRAGLATSAATSKIDTINDIWAQPIPRTKVLDDFELSGYIIDEQGKFNLNDLVTNGNLNQPIIAQFTQLLTYLNIPAGMASNIALYMASPANQSAIMSSYSTGNPPSRPAGRPLVDISELALVQGMQNIWLYKLQQYVTVIPQTVTLPSATESAIESTIAAESISASESNAVALSIGTILVNVNTATAEVISARSGIPLPTAQRMVTQRNSTPFKSQQDVTTFLSSNGIMLSQNTNSGTRKINPGTLTTQSSYFTIHTIADNGDFQFHWVALVYRANRSGQWPQIIWQHPE